MSESLQNFVDELAATFDASIVVSSLNLESWAASRQGLYIDRARHLSIIERQTPEHLRAYVVGLGVMSAGQPLLIPPNPSLGVRARLCLPIRAGEAAAFVWLLRESEEYDAVLEAIEEQGVVARCAEILAAGRWGSFGTPSDEVDVLREYLEEGSAAAVEEAESRLTLQPGGEISLLALHEVGAPAATTDAFTGIARRVIGEARLRGIVGRVDGSLVVLCSAAGALELADGLRTALGEDRLVDGGKIGVGFAVHSSGVRHTTLLQDARFAARVSSIPVSARPVARYDELGFWRLLERVPWTRESLAAMAPEVSEIIALPKREPYLTLRAFLDANGDTARCCSALHIHRTTLNYRLEQLRRIVGSRIDHGAGRADLLVGVALHELSQS